MVSRLVSTVTVVKRNYSTNKKASLRRLFLCLKINPDAHPGTEDILS